MRKGGEVGMIDRNKILKGLECHRNGFCFACPYNDDVIETTNCKRQLVEDAIELLKEQPQKAHWVKMTGTMPPEFTGHFECDNCGWHGKPFVREIDFAHCPGCGAKMSIDGLHADDCKKTPFDQILKDYLEASGGVVKV